MMLLDFRHIPTLLTVSFLLVMSLYGSWHLVQSRIHPDVHGCIVEVVEPPVGAEPG